jgi:hypothetical protein
MTDIPPEETTEGNITEIDMENRHLLIEDRNGTPFMKLFWHKAQEEFDGKPTVLFNQIRKLKPTFYVAPVIDGVDTSVSGKIKEAYLKALPWKDRPSDFPRPQKKGSGGGGRPYQPKNDRAIIHEVVYQEMHSTFRQWLDIQTEPVSFEDLMKHADTICEKAKAHAKVLSEAAGVN